MGRRHYNEKEDLIGRAGEMLAVNKMAKKGWRIKDVRYAADYQEADIDYVAVGDFGVRTVEVKTNSPEYTRNIFVEVTHTNSTTHEVEDGWFRYCRADWMAFVVDGVVHMIPRRTLTDYYKKYYCSLTYTPFSSGYLMSVRQLKQLEGYTTL